MDERTKLTIVSNYYIGGVFYFHRNILSQDTRNIFDKTVLFLYWKEYGPPPAKIGFGLCPELIYEVGNDKRIYTKDIARLIGNEKGTVVTNFEPELAALHFYPKPNKAVIFICHDDCYIANALQYEFLIDAFVAHNPFFYDLLVQKIPQRKSDIYYLPYGVEISEFKKKPNEEGPLNLVWLARLVALKGIYEIPVIDDLLKEKGIHVNWTIIGDGPDRENFKKIVEDRTNFNHASPPGADEVMKLLEDQDIFILPSRLDGLPVAMLETMSKGIVPVMYKFNNGISKIITEDIGFIVEPGDNISISNAVARLHYDRSLLQRMSERAREKAVNDFDIRNRAKEYFDLYKNVQRSPRIGKWKPLFVLHGKEFHPLIPAPIGRMLRKLRIRFFPKGK